ncbi:hypothetical protein Smic_15680 [Streptomyces microflavus]|uniref:CobE/GbiG C-terminal domain-containing protein n=1 Tax=Streptomyces microflavus TaxID=1919 RepID=A0A7J0CKK2_STRMI|nr:hypothetical protein Smic_15680 [Streptomyces microflavus]
MVEVATVDAKADEPGIVGAAARLGVPVVTYPAAALAGVRVPNPSDAADRAVGTPSVAEAAALIEADELVVEKSGGKGLATCAVARRFPAVLTPFPVSGEKTSTPLVTEGPRPFTMTAMNPPTHPPRETSRVPGPTCATTATRRCAARTSPISP